MEWVHTVGRVRDKNTREAFWCSCCHCCSWGRGTTSLGVAGLNEKGQEMEDVWGMPKDWKCCKVKTSLHGSFNRAMRHSVHALPYLKGGGCQCAGDTSLNTSSVAALLWFSLDNQFSHLIPSFFYKAQPFLLTGSKASFSLLVLKWCEHSWSNFVLYRGQRCTCGFNNRCQFVIKYAL